MSPERWQKIEDVFQAVVDLAPGERLVYLNENYADDADLIAEIERLISDYEEAGDFIESPVWTDSFMLGATVRDKIGGAIDEEIKLDKTSSMIGKRLGVYVLTKELGRGGMGAVYLAERADGEFRQRVALKVIKRGMDTDFIVRRFRNERQILATLDHPNIARLLDGGTTDDGLPFFVMEYIEGSPVYRFSDAKRLSITERLKLFVKICNAVEYAHENLIIHRDIKPTNILVTGDGMPKLLDFGIAKILNPELAADSIDPTATAMRMMTPEYASPEQVRGEVVTKVSDIYSLGVLLYELLTGHRPYRLKNRALHEIARVICEEQPDTLGSSLTRDENFVPTSANNEKTTLEAVFESRSTSREALKRELSGDLERVVFKALRKDPDERYESARELAADITRYLDGEPVLAPEYHPARQALTQSLHRTNPGEISVAVLPLKLLGAGANGDTGDDYLCIGLADALITRLSNVRRFVVRPTSSVLKYGSGDTEPFTAGEELGVNYVVDGNIRRVGTRLRVTVQLLNTSEGAARWAEKFDEEFTDVLTLEDTISEKIAEALMPQLTGDERDKLKKRGTNSAEAFEHYLHGRHYWNSFTEDGFAKAIVAYYQAIAHDPDYALAYAGIADYHNWLGVYGVLPSKECFQSAVENATKAIELDPELGEAYASLAFAQHGGNFEWSESERNFQTALRLNPNVAETHVWYSIKLTTEGRFTAGINHATRAVELDPQTPFNQHNLGWILYYARQFDKSLRQYQKTAAMFPFYPLAHYGLAWVLRYLGRFEEAVGAANRAQELMRESIFSLHVQGQTFAAAGMREQAEVNLEKLERLSEKQFVSPYHTALIYAFLDDREKALRLLESCSITSEAWLVWLGVEPAFDTLRADPRFKAVLARTGNPILGRDQSSEKPNPTIAVLPFKVINAASAQSTDDKFLGVGLADALITRLSNIRKFIVRPTSSVLRYDTENNPFNAGAELGVDFLIDGNIRRVGETLRVTVQLLAIEQGATRWAQRFDEHVTDFLTLEDSISEQIVEELLPQLTGEDREQLKKRGTNDPQAYEAYLRGRYFWNKFTGESFPKAFEAFSEAVKLDPNFAQAHVGLADYYIWLCIFGVLPSLEAFPKAKAAAARALEIDPELGEAYTTLAFATTIHDWDWEKAEQLFRRAIELSPNYSNVHEWYSNYLAAVGRFDEAIAASTRAIELNPLSARGRVMNGWLLYQTRHFRRATAEAEKAIEMEKDFPQGLLHLGNALDKAGRSDEAIVALRECIRLWQDAALPKAILCHALVNAGREAEAREALADILDDNGRHHVKPYFVAVAYAAFDDRRDAAFEWLEKAFEDRNEWLIWLGIEPKFDSLRDDPRYFQLLERMNNPIVRQQRREAEVSDAEPGTTIAVLPLKTLQVGKNGNTEEDFLGIGLADALVTRLSSVKRLIVRPTNSVIRSGKNNPDPFVIAREINAEFVVDGHVKRVGERLRVSVQLLNVAEQTAVWAQSFDEKYTDVLSLEDSVSEQIAAALLPQLTEDEKEKLSRRPTNNAKAFEAYMRGRYHWNSFTEDGLQKSLLAYREALEYDPNFALAYAGIADYYNFICIFGSKPPILSFPAAKEAAQKAIELNPNLAEAYVALGVTAFGYDWDFAEGERLFKKALELNPNYSVAHFWYALAYGLKGDHENAIREMRRAEQLSPGIPSLLVISAFVYRNARKFDKGLEKIREALSIQPNYYVAVQGFGWMVKWTENYEEAEEICKKSVEKTKRFSLPLYAYGYVLAVRGKREKALAIIKELEERREHQYIPAIYISLIYTELGEFDEAFEWLDKSFEEREFWAIWLPVDPRVDALRKDPRYNDFINRLKPHGEVDEDIHQSHIATRIMPPIEAKHGGAAAKPENKPVTPQNRPEETGAPKTSRKFWMATAAAAALIGVLGIFAYSGILKFNLSFSEKPVIVTPQILNQPNLKTITVLPFETDADYENEESFASGLSEAVGQKLRQVKGMSLAYVYLRLPNKPSLEELAQIYKINYVLRGSLHVDAERVKVKAELVNTTDGKVLWLENFDENVDNFQNLQTAISERVLKTLTVELSANEQRELSKNSTASPEAYQLYLVGRFQLSNRSTGNLNKAIKTFEKARGLDPKFALAYAGLADAYALLNLYQIPAPPDAYEKAKQNALKAIELDPNLAEAHASLGYVLFYHEHKHHEAVQELAHAIELNPSYSTAYHWLALMSSAMGRHEEAVRNIQKAIEMEPKSAIIQTAAGLVYFYARKFDEALATADKVLENNEGFVPAYKTKRVVFEATGNYSAALTAYQNERIYSENTDEDDAGWMMIAAQVQAVGGNRDEALANLKRTTENSFVKSNPKSFAYEISLAFALLGDANSTVEWLKKAKEVNSYGFNFAPVDPRFDKVRSDPRFNEIFK
ncbi:MAG TPA: tetratricopeptide repeat protein [Pyrinomonadaceae bacterium]|jgi:TolB-like protein/Flp pilus assembly protein TadD/tRNA A-37 threonylcarbamoyl transferase component Bud32